jgi:hypothetical protein
VGSLLGMGNELALPVASIQHLAILIGMSH